MSTPNLNIELFHKKIQSFHFFGVMGYILGTLLGIVLACQTGLNPLIVILMSALSAVTFFVLAFAAKLITGQEQIVYYHHEIAILIVCALALKLLHYAVLPYIDITIIGVGTFLAFGRLGCFSAGCCHGRPGRFGYRYGEEHVQDGFTWYYKNITLLPVQVAESAFVFCMVVASAIVILNHAAAGTVLILYTVVYGAFRFSIEFLRGDPERSYWNGLSEAQWTTLLLISVILLLSVTGYLPLYTWHWILFTSLLIIAAYIIGLSMLSSSYGLLNAQHVEQIAFALRRATQAENDTPGAANNGINVFTTNKGLSISSGHFKQNGQTVKHYTISGSPALKLDAVKADKIAGVIALLQHHKEFELVVRPGNVYHMVIGAKQKHEREMNLKPFLPRQLYGN